MRTTDSQVLTSMEGATRTPYCEVIIATAESPLAETTYTTSTRVVFWDILEEGYGVIGTIILDNSDRNLDSFNYIGRRIRVRIGYNTAGGDKADAELQPFWIIVQNIIAEAGSRYMVLTIENIFSRLALEPTGTEDASKPSQAPLYNATVASSGAVIENRTQAIDEIVDSILDGIKPSGYTSAGIPLSTYSIASGTHTGSNNASVLTDSAADFINDGVQVGDRVLNTTDTSEGEITARTATTITATLAGGTDNDWDISNDYVVQDALYMNDIEPMVVMRWGTPALSTISKLMDMTKTRLRMQEFGADMEAIYITDTLSNTRYNFGASGKINPISISTQEEIIRPNRIYVVDIEPDPGGVNKHRFVAVVNNTTSSDRYGVMAGLEAPTNEDEKFRDQAEADDRASALVKQIQADAAQGMIRSPVHPYLELYDYIQVEGHNLASKKGYVNRIRWVLSLDKRLGPIKYEMEVHIGGLRKYFVSQFQDPLYDLDDQFGQYEDFVSVFQMQGLPTLEESLRDSRLGREGPREFVPVTESAILEGIRKRREEDRFKDDVEIHPAPRVPRSAAHEVREREQA